MPFFHPCFQLSVFFLSHIKGAVNNYSVICMWSHTVIHGKLEVNICLSSTDNYTGLTFFFHLKHLFLSASYWLRQWGHRWHKFNTMVSAKAVYSKASKICFAGGCWPKYHAIWRVAERTAQGLLTEEWRSYGQVCVHHHIDYILMVQHGSIRSSIRNLDYFHFYGVTCYFPLFMLAAWNWWRSTATLRMGMMLSIRSPLGTRRRGYS